MKSPHPLSQFNSRPFLTIVLFLIASLPAWTAPTFKILHSFGAGTDGGGLWSGLIFGEKGNLFGATAGGGKNRYGTVFELKPQPDGTWREKILHSFSFNDPEGFEPYDGVTRDSSGNLYATTSVGGAHDRGTIFELSPGPAGWVLNVLYDFCIPPCSGAPGAGPYAGVIQDASGNLYGVGAGIFELSPGQGGWTESNLYDFCTRDRCYDGHVPGAGLIAAAKGTLYGTTEFGGKHNKGTVYKVRHMPDGTWTEHVLHHFGGPPNDGVEPGIGRLAMDSSGNLFGTTAFGGAHTCIDAGCGTIFELISQPDGSWKERIIYSFRFKSGGYSPGAGVTLDPAGNIYGTTELGGGGGSCDCGVVYRLSPNPDGSWSYTVLHAFNGSDGAFPDANPILDDKGNLYGTASQGGPGTAGVAFEITP